MPNPRRRRFRAFARNDTASSAVETALILALTAVMAYTVKATAITALLRPTKQAFATLIRALS
jgi:Flp pilus assembly pilin Flp